MFSVEAATLSDVLVVLPDDERKRIDEAQFEIYERTPPDKESRRAASAEMQAVDDAICSAFIERETIAMRKKYELDDACLFDPPPGAAFACPRCRGETLVLGQVSVIAFCKTDCGHEFEWLDSEVAGCPKCGHRPHRFQTEHESEFLQHSRTTCSCPCSSSTDCISHLDGYCPKCGELPDAYEVDGRYFCGKHHEQLVAYRCPANYLFMETELRRVDWQFPNAKLWGDADADADGCDSVFCASCESHRQRWLKAHREDEG